MKADLLLLWAVKSESHFELTEFMEVHLTSRFKVTIKMHDLSLQMTQDFGAEAVHYSAAGRHKWNRQKHAC